MNENIQKMLRMAELIRDATQVGENTAVRVGTEIYDIVVELSRMLADGSVKNRHLASNCVTSDKIQPGAVKHDHLTEDCISTGNIRDGSVTAKKLGTDIYKDISNRVTDIVTKDFPPAITEEQITDITSK